MLVYLQRLLQERTSLMEVRQRMADTAAREDRDLSESEQSEIHNMATRCTEIDTQLSRYNEQTEADRAFAALSSKMETRESDELDRVRTTEPAWISPGERFTSSEQFRAYPGYGQGQPVDLGEDYLGLQLSTRAAITTANVPFPHFVWPPREQTTITPLLEIVNHVTVSSGIVEWTEVGADPTAAVVAEGAAKPEAALTLTPKTTTLDTIAHWIQVTRQALDDARYLQSLVEGKLRRGLLKKMEADLAAAINGATGTNTATAAAAAGGLGASIRIGIGEVEADGYQPSAVLLNPADYAALDLNNYTQTNMGTQRQSTIWGLRGVAVPSLTAGTAWVLDTDGVTLFDRGVSNVFTTDSHASLFISNILVILAEARVKSAVTDPQALCKCTAT